MITRYLSIGLAAALLAFGVYHWFLVAGLKHEIKTRDDQIARQITRIASLEADNAGLTKVNADLKARSDEQTAAVDALKQAQEDVRKQAAIAVAAAERRAKRFEARATTISMAAPLVSDNLCESVESKLDAYLEDRHKELTVEGSK